MTSRFYLLTLGNLEEDDEVDSYMPSLIMDHQELIVPNLELLLLLACFRQKLNYLTCNSEIDLTLNQTQVLFAV